MRVGKRITIRRADVLIALLAAGAACSPHESAHAPVTRLDDPRVLGADPDGSRPLTVRLDGDEEVRWNDMDAAVGVTLLGAVGLSPDLVKTYVMHRTTRDGSSNLSYTVHALDCRARRVRLAGAGTLDDASRGKNAGAEIVPFPRDGAEAAIFEKVCDNRLRCDLRDQDNPCHYEQQLSIERTQRRNAIEDAQENVK